MVDHQKEQEYKVMVAQPTVAQFIVSQDILVGFLGENDLLEKFTDWMNPEQAVVILATSVFMHDMGGMSEEEADALYEQGYRDSCVWVAENTDPIERVVA
jgi:threonyl-tRNA synthetase